MRPTLEYASSIWSPMASPTSINKLQVMQNAALRACTGCTHDTNIQHLHDETNILPIQKHLQLHASQIRQKAQYPSHPLYKYTTHNNSQRLMKPTTVNNSRYTTNIPTDPCTVTTADIKANMRDIHTTIVSQHLAARDNNKILRTHPPQVSSTEENLPRHTRRTLAQLRTNKSPFLLSYLHKIDASTHPSPLCPLCRTHEHTTQHLFSCPQIPTTLSALDLWRDPSGVAVLVERELTKRLLMRILYVCLIHQYTSGCTRSHLQYIHITLPLFYSHCVKFKIVMSIYQVLCLRCRTSKCSRGDNK